VITYYKWINLARVRLCGRQRTGVNPLRMTLSDMDGMVKRFGLRHPRTIVWGMKENKRAGPRAFRVVSTLPYKYTGFDRMTRPYRSSNVRQCLLWTMDTITHYNGLLI